MTVLSLVVAACLLVGACGEDSGQALPSVPEGDVPSGDTEELEPEPLTLAGEWCVRAGKETLVFVEGRAEIEGRGSYPDGEPALALNVRHTNDDGAGDLTSAPIDVPEDAPVVPVGHAVDPDQWVNEPAEGCDGPYFLVTGFGMYMGPGT